MDIDDLFIGRWDADDWVRGLDHRTNPGVPQTDWRMKDGTLIYVRAMSLSHLRNVKQFIEKNDADYATSRSYQTICREICRRERDLSLRQANT